MKVTEYQENTELPSQLCPGLALLNGVGSRSTICTTFQVVAMHLFLFTLFCFCAMDGFDYAYNF